MRVLIFDLALSGHHAPFMRHLIRAVAELKQEITVVTQANAPQTPEYQQHLADLESVARFDTRFAAPSGSPSRFARESARILLAAAQRWNAQHVYAVYADGLSQFLALRRLTLRSSFPADCQTEGLMFRGGFAYAGLPWRSRLQHEFSRRLLPLAPWTILHQLDPIPYEWLLNHGGAWTRRLRLMPEPVEPMPVLDRATARRMLQIPEEGRYIGCAGGIDTRKGADLLLHAFASARLAATDRLLLAGRQDQTIQHLLQHDYVDLVKQNRIICVNRYLTQQDLEASFGALDVVCAPYPQHLGSSGVIVRAAALGRMALGTTYGWIGMVVPRFGLGLTVNVGDRPAFAQAIGQCLDQSPGFALPPSGHKFARYHSVNNYMAHWTDRLRQRLNQSPAPDKLSWNWVTSQ